MKKYQVLVVGLVLFAALAMVNSVAAAPDTVNQLYCSGWTQIDADTVEVYVIVHFCSACNPNDAGYSGCTPFTCGFSSYDMAGGLQWFACGLGYPAGRYVACQLERISDSQIIGPQKVVCTPTNCPLSNNVQFTFTFDGVVICEDYHVWMEAYCSLCGHWYNKCCIHPPPIPEISFAMPVVSALLASVLIPLKRKLRR